MMWSLGTLAAAWLAVFSVTGEALRNGSVPGASRRGLEGPAFSGPNAAMSMVWAKAVALSFGGVARAARRTCSAYEPDERADRQAAASRASTTKDTKATKTRKNGGAGCWSIGQSMRQSVRPYVLIL
jgi:hypothetical protein